MKKASLALTLLLAGCTGQTAGAPVSSARPQPDAGPVNLVADGYAGRFRIATGVLESERHGPQLCLEVKDSNPPQCDGPDISGWTWDGVPHESLRGTSWGSYLITGTFNGRTFRLTEPAKVSDGSLNPMIRKVDFTSPCPAPAGGWRPVDPAKTTADALPTIKVVVSADPDFANLWLDRPDAPNSTDNDPTKLVLNVRFTKDLAGHEAAIRAIWGGALCLSKATHSQAELDKIRQELAGEPGAIGISDHGVTATLDVSVWMATQSRQRELDAKYGQGLVNLVGALTPID